MIAVVRLKRLLAVLIALLMLLVFMVTVRAVANTVLRSASGADPTSIFNDIPPVPDDLVDAIAWLPDPERDGRVMEPSTRVEITDSYARALSAMDRAGRGDPDAPLADYLSGPALDTALAARDDDTATSTFHLRHELRLDVYSDDGAVVAIGAPDVEIVRVVDGASGRTITSTVEAWRFTMLLEDGNWRIQQLQTVAVEAPEVPDAPRAFTMPAIGANIVTLGGVDRTWARTGIDEMVADLDDAVALGVGTVRVFVGGPEAGEIDVEAFATFLDLAAERGMTVVPVLFDGSRSHHPTSWADDRDYLDAVVGVLAGHDALAAWDLKDAPDLDDAASGGSVNVDAWLTRTASAVRALDPDTPVTVGWSDARHAARVVDRVDVVSFQHEGGADSLRSAIADAVAVARDRPVYVAGFGSPEQRGLIEGAQPARQAATFADQLGAVDDPRLAGAFIRSLRDPAEESTSGVAAGAASVSSGLLRHDRTERATAAVLRNGDGAVPAATALERFRADPVLPTAAVVVAIVVGMWVVRRRRNDGRDLDADTTDDQPAAEQPVAERATDHDHEADQELEADDAASAGADDTVARWVDAALAEPSVVVDAEALAWVDAAVERRA